MIIRELRDPADAAAIVALFADVWQLRTDDLAPVDEGMLIALAHGGNYVALAETDGPDGPELIGACVGFFTAPPGVGLHSHIAGVRPGRTGSGVGRALKQHQRDWCLARGLRSISWTFDPLVARNAHFNLTRLGARGTQYLPDFYGPMADGLNAGQPSDRLWVEWDLRPDDGVGGSGSGSAMEPDGTVFVRIPDDIEAIRRDDPAAALAHRFSLRAALGDRLADGWTIDGFDRDRGYRLHPRPSQPAVSMISSGEGDH